MVLIEQVYEDTDIESDCVRCPLCKRGRLCDKPKGEKAFAISVKKGQEQEPKNSIILKCPKCSHKFLIYISK